MRQVGFNKQHTKAARQVAIELVAHLLGTYNQETNHLFRQAQRVFTYEPSKMNVYASVPMINNPNTLLFETTALDKTALYTGYNYTTAKAAATSEAVKDGGLALAQQQKHAYAGTKTTGVVSNGINAVSATAKMGVMQGIRPATVVTIPASDKLEKALVEDIRNGVPNLSKFLKGKTGTSGGQLKSRTYGLEGRRLRMDKTTPSGKAMFWALPYIGVLQSEYLDENK